MSLFGAGKGTPGTAASTGSLGGSTLFGNTGTTTPAAGAGNSIFGSTTTGSSLFNKPAAGATAAPAQQQPSTGFGSSLFGTSTTTPKQSLLGNPQAGTGTGGGGATTQSSLFPGLSGTSTTATTQAPGASFLSSTNHIGGGFGNLGNSTSGAQNAAASTNQQAPLSGALPTGALFDSLLQKNKKQAEGETALGELPSLQLGLGDLRQRLKKLGPSQDRPLEHGKAHYFLAASGVDPGAAVRDLGAFGLQARAERGTTPGTTGFGVGAGEVDVETYLSNLQTKTTLSMIADGLERSVRDFDSFLEENVTMEWEEQRKRIYQHFGIKPREDSAGGGTTAAARASTPAKEGQGTFGRSKRKGTQPVGGERATQRMSVLGRSAMQRSVIGTPSRIGAHAPEFADVEASKGTTASPGGVSMDDRFLREKQGKLAEKIHEFNDARQRELPFYICRDMAELESKTGDRHAQYIVQAYQAVMEIVGENPDADEAPRERQFAKLYLDPNPQSASAIAMRKQILKGANSFLEKQFWNEVNSLIAKYPQDANLGGLPDVVSKTKAYIRLRYARKTLVPDGVDLQQANGDYIWAIVFYLLRAGFVNEAAQYVNSNQNHFRSIDRTFSGYINSYASSEERRLKRQMQDRCTSEYNQRIRNAPDGSIDPFRMACYKIIGRCDLSNRSLDRLQTDVNDWIWLQFNLARETDRSQELAGESYGLNEVQASIREVGLKHFAKTPAEDVNGQFGMFFYMQVLSGMFEQAIAYLYPFSYVDAVHFAIALTYYGLLRPADAQSAANELLSHNTRNLPQINFGRMLGYYTRDFRAANVAAAVDYLVFICLNADEVGGQQQAALCHEALRELVLESREFSRLIGDIKPDGQRIKGVIEERGPLIALGQEDEFIRTITLQAASFADDNGRTTDAVLLFHLAGDYDTVVSIVSRALSEAVSLEIGEDPMKLVPVKPRVEGDSTKLEGQPSSSLSLAAIDDPVELAKTMMGMYERDHMFWQKIRDPNRVACAVLLQMSDIKSLVEAGKWPQCLDRIRALEILPLTARGDPSVVRSYAARFSSLPQPVAINVPNLLLWTIVCCTKQRERLMNGQFSGNESTARLMIEELKQMSIDLTAYTSQLRYRLPPHLHEALARASAD
ncbi:Nucleoporin NIC96 [Madurella mycetomatis]|uniref:Nucleoporin NIC96 n=1 Tax=Madurella mycetomatis TaxID=100816 RepID=A0A175VXW7_9PEZI|nr:Nucleoporin NIC96 [Madurella mycetomatis]